ncbi:hypothetical protein SAMN06297280_3392 [Arsukibacterium tuosuense]|uniref:Uncharacterized protein n=1 Tax=Arsukibacterium tuosuense TaxID=1323745 RepID=A0A285JDR2_9GAMM|nr:HEPN domain-containing protein [Arsukibacterium tuosuense]SNY58408.1 hypothetical protein SAMN06297280_3392 [Arsukibacterium tuosuense]
MLDKDLSHSALKAYQRQHREHFPENLALRVHRALSWLNKAEQARLTNDTDTEFIYYWISFNAAYANEFGESERMAEQQHFQAFLAKIADLDQENLLFNLIWQQFSSSIRLLMDNKYVYQPFWDFQRGRLNEEDWQKRFAASKTTLNKALADKDVPLALSCIFTRLYTLRNQLIHGGATHNSSINREQLKDACNLLNKLIPLVIALMMSAPEQLWGEGCYPVVK